jgi:hypothetical protein
VHRSELVVKLGKHDAARGVRRTEPVADERNRRAWIGQLIPHEHHEREAKKQKQQARNRILDADYFVILRKDVLSPESQLHMLFMGMAMRMFMRWRTCGRHLFQRRLLPGYRTIAK